MYQKECSLTLKVRRLIIVGLLDPLQHNDRTYTDSKDKAIILNDYFTSIFISEDGSMPTLAMDGSSFPDISPLLIHDEGVGKLLSNLDDHQLQASGPDKIPTTLLKNWLQ